ncbi:Arc family DNA-binding protein [Pararhizobium gei]|uniref:Arc family DNA-binding protein n=1 Tax=Pararhizobium gei TaxID=1395951 RepID=UPI0023DC3015|nr:Arc family DNA-binding protein [Rhizobium gei]
MPAKQTDPQFKMRLPADLKKQLEEAAHNNDRTISAEMIARLRLSFDAATDFDILNEIKALRDDFARLNTTAYVNAIAKAGNHLTRHDRPPTPDEIEQDAFDEDQRNKLQENIGPEDEDMATPIKPKGRWK